MNIISIRQLILSTTAVSFLAIYTVPSAGEEAQVRGIVSANVALQSVGEFEKDWPQPLFSEVRLEHSVRIPMRDGVRLSTDFYFPIGAGLPLPVVLIRTPYGKDTFSPFYARPGSIANFWAGQGFIVAVQDVRGRHESEGEFVISKAEKYDGYDTVGWLARQSWTTDKVGTYGCSYLGESQIQLAAAQHPSHAAAIAQAAGGGYIGTGRPFAIYNGGALELASAAGWFHAHGEKIFGRPPFSLTDAEFNYLAPRFQTKLKRDKVDFADALYALPIANIFETIGFELPTDWHDFVLNSPLGDYFTSLNYLSSDDKIDVPTLHINSWYDGAIGETFILFNLFKKNAVSASAKNNQHVIVSPTGHCGSEYAADTAKIGERKMHGLSFKYFAVYVDWFNHFLKGKKRKFVMPAVQYYLMGADQWRSSDAWPLPNTQYTKFYLRGGPLIDTDTGSLSIVEPESAEIPDEIVYDPLDPAPSLGGPFCCIDDRNMSPGAFDQREIERRPDVLTYSTMPLEQDTEVTGPISAVIWASSSARDTDISVKLVDVFSDGTAYNIQEGIRRGSYRLGYDKRIYLDESEIVPFEINLHATSVLIKKNHRIRVEISSSNFPRFDRNTNLQQSNTASGKTIVARNLVHHSNDHRSYITLPIVASEER